MENGKGTRDADIERLRQSKAQIADADEALGRDNGRIWAKEVAEHDELKRVAQFYTTHQDSFGDISWNAPYDAGGWLYAAILDEEGPDHDDVGEFWDRWAKRKDPSESFVEGFARGASEFLDENADQL